MGYLYLALAVAGFTLLGLSYKWSDQLCCDKRQVNAFFLSTAALVMVLWTGAAGVPAGSGHGIIIAAIMGVTVFLNVLTFREAAAKGPISVSFTVVNLSVVVPVISAILFWREIPSVRHSVGLALTLLAIVLFGMDIGRGHK
jgi:drug/metabolite transporter (DMT)-like permease